MLYSDILLEAAKSVSLADGDLDSLSNDDKKLYAGYLCNAIARFNNNPYVSIGTEKVILREWKIDEFSYFARIVRNMQDNNLEPLNEGGNKNISVSKIKRRGPNGRSLQEIPQRLVSATVLGNSVGLRSYRIVNEKNFFEHGRNTNEICYVPEENQGIVRVWEQTTLLLLFDRAILYPWEARPEESKNTVTGFHDPLDVQIMIPSSHAPYLICLAALELANGIKCDEPHVAQLKDQLHAQEKDLMRNNVRDRVKLSFGGNEDAATFWSRRCE